MMRDEQQRSAAAGEVEHEHGVVILIMFSCDGCGHCARHVSYGLDSRNNIVHSDQSVVSENRQNDIQ